MDAPAPNGAKGSSWTGKYRYVYMDGFEIDTVSDGLNEAGLGFGRDELKTTFFGPLPASPK